MFFFFFRQKTAYEMRISDWSSDVCSSDLRSWLSAPEGGVRYSFFFFLCGGRRFHRRQQRQPDSQQDDHRHEAGLLGFGRLGRPADRERREPGGDGTGHRIEAEIGTRLARGAQGCERSEEHTSELQSLMRISYAVFCLKKKNKQKE